MFWCLNAGKARQCPGCIHNPINQRTESQRQKISPTVAKDGNCKTGVQKINVK